MFVLSITNKLTAPTNTPRISSKQRTSISRSPLRLRVRDSRSTPTHPRHFATSAGEGGMATDMSHTGKSSSNEDKLQYSLGDTNIVHDRNEGGVAGDMSGTGKSSSNKDKKYTLGYANIVNESGVNRQASDSMTAANRMPPSDVGNIEPGMRPQKTMTEKMQERGSESADPRAGGGQSGLMTGDDSEMMGRDEEMSERRHQAAGSGGGDTVDQGSLPTAFQGDEARQQASQMAADI